MVKSLEFSFLVIIFRLRNNELAKPFFFRIRTVFIRPDYFVLHSMDHVHVHNFYFIQVTNDFDL